MSKIVYLGADHRGFKLKEFLKERLQVHGYQVFDEGAFEYNPDDDYPIFAFKVAEKVRDGGQGILLCGSGVGVCIAANKVKGIRAMMSTNSEIIKMAKRDDDINILALPADFITPEEAWQIVEVFLNTEFEPSEKHLRRIKQIEDYEKSSASN